MIYYIFARAKIGITMTMSFALKVTYPGKR